MRGSRNFCQFYLILSLFYSLQRESNGFIAEKTILIITLIYLYLYFTKDPEGVYYFQGGVQHFPGGPNANFYRNPYTYLLFSRGVGFRTPWIRTWAMSS